MYGGCLQGVRRMFGGYLPGVFNVSQGFHVVVFDTDKCQETLWEVFVKYLEGFSMVSGNCLEGLCWVS